MTDALLADLRALADVFASEERVWHRANPTSYLGMAEAMAEQWGATLGQQAAA